MYTTAYEVIEDGTLRGVTDFYGKPLPDRRLMDGTGLTYLGKTGFTHTFVGRKQVYVRCDGVDGWFVKDKTNI
jgi:hypothetical protein